MGAKRKFREGLTNDVTHDQGVLLIQANGGGGEVHAEPSTLVGMKVR